MVGVVALGLLWTLGLNGMLGLGAYLVSRYGFQNARGSARGLGALVLAWGWVTLGMQLLGPFGGLTRASMLGWTSLGLALGIVCWAWRRRGSMPQSPTTPPGDPSWRVEAMLALGLTLWAATLLGLRGMLHPVKVMSDGPIYHLWFAGRWWQEGRLFLVPAPFGESVTTYFPNNGALWYTWLMIAWGGDLLSKVGQAPFLLAAGLATFAMARRLGAGATPSAIATAWFVTMSPLMVFAFEPNVDAMVYGGYLLGCYFFLRYGLKDDGAKALALGALAMGGCLGSKPSGVVLVPPVLALLGVVVLLRPTPARRKLAELAILAALPMVLSGFWYLQNAWLTGNPLYPLHVELAGRTLLQGQFDPEMMRFSSYYIDPSDWRAFVDLMLQVFDPRLIPFWMLAVLGAWSLGRKDPPGQASEDGKTLRRWVWIASALSVLNLAIYWGLVPYRTQQRFMFQGAGLAVPALALLFEGRRWRTWLALGLLALHLLTPQPWPFAGVRQEDRIPWDFHPMVPNALPGLILLPLAPGDWASAWSSMLGRRTGTPALLGLLSVIGPFAIGASAFLASWCWVRALREGSSRRRAVAALGLTGLLAVGILVTFPWGTSSRTRFFPLYPDYYSGWLALDRAAGRDGARIAYAGTNLPYYLMGPELRNEVRYVNVNAQREWLMHDYHRQAIDDGRPSTWPGPRPEWDRQETDVDAWLENLRHEGIELLVVARHNRFEPWPIERQWADSAPDRFVPLHGHNESDPQFRLYRVEWNSR